MKNSSEMENKLIWFSTLRVPCCDAMSAVIMLISGRLMEKKLKLSRRKHDLLSSISINQGRH